MTYTQPQPSYTTGNANGITGALEPYDRPGKVKQFRTYAFFLQPTQENADNFWNEVVDPVWLANSEKPTRGRCARRSSTPRSHGACSIASPTVERFLPPVSTDAIVVPQITPGDGGARTRPGVGLRVQGRSPRRDRVPRSNPGNDIEANVVLAAPTSSGASAGTIAASGPNTGLPVLPNNVIPFDLVKGVASIVSWGDSANVKLLTQLTTSVLGLNTVPMTAQAVPGTTKLYDVLDPVGGGPLYTVYTDPNGLTVNVLAKPGMTVYQDVNGNPIQYYDGKTFHSLQADYVASTDGTVMYYIEPPSTYDQSTFDLIGDYDLFGHPGDQWRYYLVSGMSANMTSEPTVTGSGPFLSSGEFTGLRIAACRAHGRGREAGTGLRARPGHHAVAAPEHERRDVR